jgi:hypothetical protein
VGLVLADARTLRPLYVCIYAELWLGWLA